MDTIKQFVAWLTGKSKLVPVPQRVPVIEMTDTGVEIASAEVIRGMITASAAVVDDANKQIAKRTTDMSLLGTLLEFHAGPKTVI